MSFHVWVFRVNQRFDSQAGKEDPERDSQGPLEDEGGDQGQNQVASQSRRQPVLHGGRDCNPAIRRDATTKRDLRLRLQTPPAAVRRSTGALRPVLSLRSEVRGLRSEL